MSLGVFGVQTWLWGQNEPFRCFPTPLARQGLADQQSNGLMPCAGVMRCGTAGTTPSGGAHRGDGGLSALARTQPLAAPHTEENPVQLQDQIRSAGLAVLEWKCRFLSLLN